MNNWYLGTMGFGYKEWMGNFYPPNLKSRDFLAYYSHFFNTVEIDSTFYGTPKADSVERWGAVTPTNFQFCPKTPRAITHDQRLLNVEAEMSQFIETVQLLGEKLGPVLIQLPPDFSVQEQDNLRTFLAQLPQEVRFVVEFRHPSWDQAETAQLLGEYEVCLAAADYIHMPKQIYRTTDFLYLRWIGHHGRFKEKNREQLDTSEQLQEWWQELQPHLNAVHSVYGYFNNDFSGHSPTTCNRFKQIIGLPTSYPQIPQQGRLL